MKTKVKLTLLMIGYVMWSYAQVKGTILIENVNIIPMDREIVLSNQNVVIVDGKIISIKPFNNNTNHSFHHVINGTGKYVLPGFSEMHYHWRNKQGGIERDFKLLISHGVTTVRNMAEYDWQDQISIKDSIEKGEKFGPNYFTTGPYLNSSNLKTEEDAIAVVKNHENKGYDYLKLADNLPRNVYLKVLQEAQKRQVPVIGHAQREMPLEFSLRMKSIEHLEEFIYVFKDEQRNDSLFLSKAIEQIKTSGSVIVPTLVVFNMIINSINDDKFQTFSKNKSAQYMLSDDFNYWNSNQNPYRIDLKGKMIKGLDGLPLLEEYFKWMKTFIKMLADADITLMTGSDKFGFVVPGFSLHEEFQLLHECGLSPYEILKATTVSPARYLNILATEGTISVGKNANLVLLNANPLDDIKNTQAIEGVVLKGKWFNRRSLDRMLKEVKSSNKNQSKNE